MSTLKADTLVAADGTSPVTLTKQSAAKAWAEIDGDAATVVAFDSFNASSFDDDGTGLYTFHLSSSMSDANYCMATNAARNAQITTSNRAAASAAEDSNSVLVGLRNLSGTAVDAEHIGCVVFGDLA